MPGSGQIELHRSNNMDRLVVKLAEILKARALPPLQKEWIVVQGPAMQRWLSIQLSQELGVFANARFPFPRHLVNQAVLSVLGQDPDKASGLDAGPLFWAIAQELEERIDDADFGEIRNYLSGGQDPSKQDPRKRFELADRVARLFDRYTVYRPDLLQSWEQGEETGWQPAMWRSLSGHFGKSHTGAMLKQFLREVGNEKGPIEGIPDRICLFGISALPPLYMRAISALATRVETHLFVLSPSQQYWADIRRNKGRIVSEDEPEEGNPLLLSLGRLSGDFQQVLEVNAVYNETGPELYMPPTDEAGGHLLATIQGDILELRHRRKVLAGEADAGHDEQNPPPLPLQPGDESISIHCCHSPMRELEILHDQLVARLEADPSLDARDIVVMAPNIEEYAPLIEAVFASAKEDRPRIPYRIADRADQSTYPVLQAFAQILTILSGRLPAPAVLDLLDLDSIRNRFKITEAELPKISKWIVESGVRWGEDKEHRESVDQPDFSENTWRFGLDRLLLGYALESEGRETYNQVLAYDDVEGTSADLLGRLLNFCQAIFDARDAVSRTQGPSEWAATLLRILRATIVSTEENEGEHQLIRDSIATMEQDATVGRFTGKVPYESICTFLESAWQQGGSTRGFLSGGVTFCQLMPMRSIPFRVVCLLGMSDGVFPRATQPLGFDRIASEPRLGDRTTRDDDRYLFLEAIMAAKECLFISYVGRSIKNNAELPPSVLVGELIDVLEDSFTVDAGTVDSGEVRNKLITTHPLQPFSPQYFDDSNESGLFSYSAAYCAGANSLAVSELDPRHFLAGPLSTDPDTDRIVTLDNLANFFQRPTQHLLEKRLRVFLAEDESTIDGREPIELAGLDSWKVADDLLEKALQGTEPKELYSAFRAAGRLPLGVVGESWFEEVEYAIGALYDRAKHYTEGPRLDNLPVELTIGDSKLTGSVDKIWEQGRVQVAYSRLGKRSEIGHWIRHLALCVVSPESHPRRTILIGRPEEGAGIATIEFEAVDEAELYLDELVKLYWAGQVAPLPFFPNTGRKFIKSFLKAKEPGRESPAFEKALDGARDLYTNGPWMQKAESEDPYVAQVFRDDECLELDYRPFDEVPADYADFPTIAATLLCPLLRHRGDLDS